MIDRAGQIDVLVNNAGLSGSGTVLGTSTSAYLVAEQIRLVVEGEERHLRFPIGLDTLSLLNWRAGITDRQWVALGNASDTDWSAVIRRHFGIDVPCNAGSVSDETRRGE